MRRFLLFLSVMLAGCGGPATVRVVSVTDGDTIAVEFPDHRRERVRIVGIDTPETVDPRKSVQCYGPEASARATALLSGRDVLLETKPDEDRDKYGRLLRYVRLNGVDIGAELVEEGYARAYDWYPHPRMETYDALQREAKQGRRGLWGACARS